MREALEVGALKVIAQHAAADQLTALGEHLDAMEQAMGDGDWLAAAGHDLAFHRALVALAGNRRMSATYEQMLAQTLLLLQTAGSANARLRSDMPPAIHRELHAALVAGDVAGAARAIDRHYRHAEDRLFAGLERGSAPSLDAARALAILCQQLTMSSATFRERPWTRVELVSMDGQCDDITIALYRQDTPDGAIGIVHSYSSAPGAPERVRSSHGPCARSASSRRPATIRRRSRSPAAPGTPPIARRLFLEAVKVDQREPVEPRPLAAPRPEDRPDDRGRAAGRRRPTASRARRRRRRAEPGARRGARPAQARRAAGRRRRADRRRFPCGADHDALVGLLLPRAVNVRPALREEELQRRPRPARPRREHQE